MIYFVDSNIFLRTLIKEDEKSFGSCYRFLELVQKKRIKAFTSSLILVEINWVLRSFYKFKKPNIVEAVKSILNLKGLKITDRLNPALALEIFQSSNVKFVDALIASNSEIFKKEMIVVSYDRDFDKIEIIRKEPSAIIKNIS